MTEEQYLDYLIAHAERFEDGYYDELEDRYEPENWDYDGFYHY